MHKILSSALSSNRVVFLIVACLFATIIIDTTFAKTYDLISGGTLLMETKKIIFSVIVSFCLLLQFLILRYTRSLTTKKQLSVKLSLKFFERSGRFAYYFMIGAITFLVFQILYFDYYYSFLLMLIILVSYGISAILIGKTTILFLSWYRQTRNLLILMYFISMSLILCTLILTNLIVNIHINERPEKISDFVGGSIDITGGKYSYFNPIYKITSILSFLSIWMTTSILMYSSKDPLARQVSYWIMPVILLSYFLTSYLFQEIYRSTLVPLLQFNPILPSIVLIMIFTLSKPIGGIMFGVAFWNISKKVSFEKALRGFMIISGYGFLLLFGSNQANSLVLTPYPPFGVATVTILIVSSYLLMVGIYTSAALVSINNNVRNSIHQMAKESKLLDFIGKAEMEKEVTKIVNKLSKETEIEEDIAKTTFNLDERELKEYIIEVADELRKKRSN
jgi:hypothetical protein